MAGILGVSWAWLPLKPEGEVGPGLQGLELGPACLEGSLLSSDQSPSEKPGGGGYCDLSQLSGEAKHHHHEYPGRQLQAVVFGSAEKHLANHQGVYASTLTPAPPFTLPPAGMAGALAHCLRIFSNFGRLDVGQASGIPRPRESTYSFECPATMPVQR